MRPTPEGALESLVERIDGVPPGGVAPDTVPTGFPSLDRTLGGGFRRQDLVVLCGDVGSGKSALGLAERVALAVRALKALAVERNLAVVALAQLPGLRRERPDPRPTLDDLGAFGAIKQSADLVLALYREEMYRPAQGVEGATELIVAKNRNGPTGFVDLYFHARHLRFEDMLDP